MAWTVDTSHTSIDFSVRHLGLATVRGKFTRFNAALDVDPSDFTRASGKVEIDAASIDTGDEKRDGHLQSADFFDVAQFPQIVFALKRVDGSGSTFHVVGDLTIKDVTHEVELEYEHYGDVKDPFGNRKIGGALRGSINRRDWGLTWNAPLEAGGWLVGDKVNIEVEGELAESKEAVEQEVAAEARASR